MPAADLPLIPLLRDLIWKTSLAITAVPPLSSTAWSLLWSVWWSSPPSPA